MRSFGQGRESVRHNRIWRLEQLQLRHVFELTKSGSTWKETILHAFLGSSQKDGYLSQAGLSFDTAGNLYGTTQYGGLNNQGSAFQLQPSKTGWKYRVIHSFSSLNGDGYEPVGGITQGADGFYYGTTYYGGNAYNAGTMYRLFQARNTWVDRTYSTFSKVETESALIPA